MRKKKSVFEQKRTPVTLEELGIPKCKRPKAKLNTCGELINEKTPSEMLGESDKGEYYYTKKGKEYFGIQGPNGKVYNLKLSRNMIGPIVADYIFYMRDKGLVKLPELEGELIIREADFPFVQIEGKSKDYSGKKIDLKDGRKLLVIDSKLSDAEKIAISYHEIVHARGIYDERITQLETIHGLRQMLGSYQGLMKNEDEWEKYFSSSYDPDILEERKGTIREAVNYAIGSRGSFDVSFSDIKRKLRSERRRGLEKVLVVISIFSILLSFFMISRTIIGYVTLESSRNYNMIGFTAFIIGILSYIFLEILKWKE